MEKCQARKGGKIKPEINRKCSPKCFKGIKAGLSWQEVWLNREGEASWSNSGGYLHREPGKSNIIA